MSRKGPTDGGYYTQAAAYAPSSLEEDEASHMAKMEEQFILRVPPRIAERIRSSLRREREEREENEEKEEDKNEDEEAKDEDDAEVKSKTSSSSQAKANGAKNVREEFPGIQFTMQEDGRNVVFQFGKEEFVGTFVDLPCFLEVHKTRDRVNYFKSGDIGQMLLVHDPDQEDNPIINYSSEFKMYSGITAPTRNIRKRKFRKPEKMKQQINEVEEEILRIMRGGVPGEDETYELVEQVEESAVPKNKLISIKMPTEPTTPRTPGGGPAELPRDATLAAAAAPATTAQEKKDKKDRKKEKKERKKEKKERKEKKKQTKAETAAATPGTESAPSTPSARLVSQPFSPTTPFSPSISSPGGPISPQLSLFSPPPSLMSPGMYQASPPQASPNIFAPSPNSPSPGLSPQAPLFLASPSAPSGLSPLSNTFSSIINEEEELESGEIDSKFPSRTSTTTTPIPTSASASTTSTPMFMTESLELMQEVPTPVYLTNPEYAMLKTDELSLQSEIETLRSRVEEQDKKSSEAINKVLQSRFEAKKREYEAMLTSKMAKLQEIQSKIKLMEET